MLIGLCGYQGVGKSTVARQLRVLLSKEANTIILPMAEALRNKLVEFLRSASIYKEYYDIPKEIIPYVDSCITNNQLDPWIKPTPTEMRQLLIKYGNYMRKAAPSEYWSNLWEQSYDRLQNIINKPNVIVDDIRYKNEALAIQAHKGKLIYLYRAGINQNPELESEDLSWLKDIQHRRIQLISQVDIETNYVAKSILKDYE